MAAPSTKQMSLKQMARTKDLKVGHFIVEFATPGIGQILKAAGCDFALLDTEHSGFGIDTVKQVLRYMQAADLPTIVRVPSREYHHIARAADAGAEGVMLPSWRRCQSTPLSRSSPAVWCGWRSCLGNG